MQRIIVLFSLMALFFGNSFGWVDPASKIKKVTTHIKLASIQDKETGELKTFYDDCAFKVYNGEGRVIFSYGSKKESVETPCRAYTVAETPDYVIIVNENSSSAKKCQKLEYDGNTWNTYPLGNCYYTRSDCIRPKTTCSNGVNEGWRNYQEIVKKNAGLVSERKVLENSFEAEVGKNVIELYFDRKIQLEGDQVTYRGKVYRLSNRDHQMLVRFILNKSDCEGKNHSREHRYLECKQGRLTRYDKTEEEIASGRCDPVEVYTIFDAYEDNCDKKDCAPPKEVVEYANKMCAKGEKSYCKSVQEKNKAENLARKKAADVAEKKARKRAEKENFLESYDSDRDGFCSEGYEESSMSNLCEGLDLCPGLSGTSPDGCTEEVRAMMKEDAKETIELQIRQLFDSDNDGFCSEEFVCSDKWGECAKYAADYGIKERLSFKKYKYSNPFLSKAETKAAIADAKEKVCTKGYIDACPYNWGRSMGCSNQNLREYVIKTYGDYDQDHDGFCDKWIEEKGLWRAEGIGCDQDYLDECPTEFGGERGCPRQQDNSFARQKANRPAGRCCPPGAVGCHDNCTQSERNSGGRNYDNGGQRNENGLFVNGKKVKFW